MELPMSNTLRQLINSASGTLTKLDKIRCVESYPLPPACKSINLFAWPNTKYLDKEGAAFLENRGARLRDHHIKTFSVPYSLYDEMQKVEIPSVTAIKKTRALLDVFKIVTSDAPVTSIQAVWDTTESPNRAAPRSMSDIQGLRDFGTHPDSFLVFHREGEEFDIKLRPFALPALLLEIPELSHFEVLHNDLREFTSDKVDHRARKNRNIVFRPHRDYLKSVLDQTSYTIEKLINNNDLVTKIHKLYREHY